MVLSGKTSSGGAGAPKHVAQRTSRQQLQTEHPAEGQVSRWRACLYLSAVELLVGSSTSEDNINRSTPQWVESSSEQPNACRPSPFYNLYPVLKQDTKLQVTPAVICLVCDMLPLLLPLTCLSILYYPTLCIDGLQHIYALSFH